MATWLSDFSGILAISDLETMAEWNRSEHRDYQDSCTLRGYMGIFPRNGKDVLVFNYEGGMFGVDWLDGFRVYQWVSGSSIEVVDNHLYQWQPSGEPLQTLEFRIDGEELCIQEAVESQTNGPVPRLIIPVGQGPGIYEVRVYRFKPDSETEQIVYHAMRRLDEEKRREKEPYFRDRFRIISSR